MNKSFVSYLFLKVFLFCQSPVKNTQISIYCQEMMCCLDLLQVLYLALLSTCQTQQIDFTSIYLPLKPGQWKASFYFFCMEFKSPVWVFAWINVPSVELQKPFFTLSTHWMFNFVCERWAVMINLAHSQTHLSCSCCSLCNSHCIRLIVQTQVV